jgi:hypothetical protein
MPGAPQPDQERFYHLSGYNDCTMRFFNTAGPVNCQDHYCLPPLSRFDLSEILTLISQKKYFVLHAPGQSGKTSCLLALRDLINHEDTYSVLYINVEIAQTAQNNVERGMKAILSQLAYEAEEILQNTLLLERRDSLLLENGEDAVLGVALSLVSKDHKRPLILLIDEIDALVGDTLISVLRQIRAGYTKRPALFPVSVILCGVRDVRDYRIHSEWDGAIITGGSAINIKAKSLRLGNFSEEETRNLLLEHTNDTGQVFDEEALASIWSLTNGQPWLVNALASWIPGET